MGEVGEIAEGSVFPDRRRPVQIPKGSLGLPVTGKPCAIFLVPYLKVL